MYFDTAKDLRSQGAMATYEERSAVKVWGFTWIACGRGWAIGFRV